MEQIRIKVRTDVLERQANAAEKKIKQVRSRFERIGTIVRNSGSYWEGDANNAHRREFQEYQDEIEEALRRFCENIADLRKMANIYHSAQEEAYHYSQDLPADVIV